MKGIRLSIIVPIKDIDFWINNIIKNIDLFRKYNFKHEFLFIYSTKKDNSVRKLKKILEKEHQIYPLCIQLLIEQKIALKGNKVIMDGCVLPETGIIYA